MPLRWSITGPSHHARYVEYLTAYERINRVISNTRSSSVVMFYVIQKYSRVYRLMQKKAEATSTLRLLFDVWFISFPVINSVHPKIMLLRELWLGSNTIPRWTVYAIKLRTLKSCMCGYKNGNLKSPSSITYTLQQLVISHTSNRLIHECKRYPESAALARKPVNQTRI